MSELNSAVLLKSATAVDVDSSFHLKKVDILIEEGNVSKIGEHIESPDGVQVVDAAGQYIGAGWCDIGAHCGEPGDEIHETIQSLSNAAQAGGYTHIGLFSNRVRPFDNRHIISDIKNQSTGADIIPIGTVSKNLEGKELAELLDLNSVAPGLFSDGFHRKFDNSMYCKALEYANQCNATLLTIPGAHRSIKKGQVNESKVSAQMGIPGMPGFEEVSTLAAELSLVSYANSPVFVHLVSHRESVDLLKYRTDQGLLVTSSVSSMHLLHSEEDVAKFDENFKILPPLRDNKDRLALIDGLRNGIIQIVVSNHQPISMEQKEREFGESPFGATGLETTFLGLATAIPDLTPEEVVTWLATNSRKALQIDNDVFKIGAKADFTLFALNGKTHFESKNSHSMSNNSPYPSYDFSGRIFGTVFGKRLYLAG